MNGLSLLDTFFNDSYYTDYTRTANVDVRATKDAYLLDMELPGKTESDVSLTLKEKVLTIACQKALDKNTSCKEKENTTETSFEKYLLKERSDFSFTRSFSLPEDVDTENISAAFKNGILTVTMPRKAELCQEKKIEIRNIA